MTELLQQIARNTEPKRSMQIIVSGRNSWILTQFIPPVELNKDRKYEIALINLETYYSFPNVDDTNNVFWYSKQPENEGEDRDWIKIKIPEGSYELNDINLTIQQFMKDNGDYDEENDQPYIEIKANVNTLKSVLILRNNYQVDFSSDKENTITSLLGFDKQIYSDARQESQSIVNILSINSIQVKISHKPILENSEKIF